MSEINWSPVESPCNGMVNWSVDSFVAVTLSKLLKKQCSCRWIEMSWRADTLQWRHNERDGVSNHQPHDCLLNLLFRRRSNKTSKLRITGLWAGKSPVTGEFPAQRASNAENVSIWWRHHVRCIQCRIESVSHYGQRPWISHTALNICCEKNRNIHFQVNVVELPYLSMWLLI